MTLVERLRHEAAVSEELDAANSSVEVMREAAQRISEIEAALQELCRAGRKILETL